jgi:hypothetical protein
MACGPAEAFDLGGSLTREIAGRAEKVSARAGAGNGSYPAFSRGRLLRPIRSGRLGWKKGECTFASVSDWTDRRSKWIEIQIRQRHSGFGVIQPSTKAEGCSATFLFGWCLFSSVMLFRMANLIFFRKNDTTV